MNGVHAPGVKNLDHAIAAAHHTAMAHAEATRAVKSVSSNARTGLALNMTNYRITDPGIDELETLAGLMDSHLNRWWIEAAYRGSYPENLVESYGDKLAAVLRDGDLAQLKVDNDFLGVNYYSDSFISAPKATDKPMSEGGLFPFPQRAGADVPQPRTDMGWPVTPRGLGDLMLRIHRDYPEVKSLSITENGAAYDDGPNETGEVNDVRRIDYMVQHIESLGDSIAQGAPVHSYYAWSFLDNYEWAEGYAKRFGIVHVDFDTQQRTPKKSALTYRALISAHADSANS